MARDRTNSSASIFFPWERRRGAARLLGTGRARPVAVVVFSLLFVVAVGSRERRQSGVRQTRATLLSLRSAVDGYMAENEGACPPNLDKVLDYASAKKVPSDAWGNKIRLVCPARRQDERYELMSDGPDGKPGGLDRIE
ncbi:MAG: type II secretion system protein GspG [Polyangiaceae bacterium]